MREVTGEPRKTLVFRGWPPLRGAGFPAKFGVAEGCGMTGATARADDVAHAVVDDIHGLGIHAEPIFPFGHSGLDDAAAGVLELADEAEFRQSATVRDASHRLRDLQRRGKQTALAD